MDLIKTGIGITKTIRNVGRMKEIALVFAKNGFDEFASLGVASQLPDFVIPKSKRSIKDELEEQGQRNWERVLGHRLRLCFEELGPAFIKFGQLLSSREDLFGQGFIDEMKILRDKVKPVPFELVKGVIENSLEGSIESTFKFIDSTPIGTASIGVVYKGELFDGREVVIKVKRPGIEKMIETDLSILTFLAAQIERASDEIRYLGISRILKDFGLSIVNELNFNTEVLNCGRYQKVLAEHDRENFFYLPQMYPEYCSRDVLVMELLKGIPFSNYSEITKKLDILGPRLDEGLQVFIKTFLKNGFFHADLHGGNFFFLENEKIGIIDFGLMGTLSRKGRQNFIAMIYSLLTFNYENVVYEFLEVALYEQIPDIDILINDVKDALSPYIGLTVQQTEFSEVLKSVISTLKTHEIFLPREWFIVFRALVSLDGVGKSLGLDFDIYSMMEGDIKEIISQTFNKEELIEDGLWAAKDFVSMARVIPRHVRWFLKDFSHKKYGIKVIHTGHEKSAALIHRSLIFLGFSLISSIFIASGVFFLGTPLNINSLREIPTITWIFWLIATLFFIRGNMSISKK